MPNLDYGFVAVHAGAGYHSTDIRTETLRACKEACRKAYGVLMENSGDCTALDACVAATVILENDPITNAGIGSNLTLAETVECDAGLMDGRRMNFAGVGCVSNVKNPILLSKKLLDVQNDSNANDQSLVPPMVLAGQGAVDLAKKSGLDILSDADMITKRSLAGFRKALVTVSKRDMGKDPALLDTVGVIVVNNRGQVAASCSSGGLLLKHPGRIGHAAHFGSGAWAQELNSNSVAVSCSGCGEYLIRTSLAQSIGRRLFAPVDVDQMNSSTDVLGRTLKDDFLDSQLLSGLDEWRKIAGAIALKTEIISDKEMIVDFAYGHCSPTFCIAYTVPQIRNDSKICRVRYSMSDCPVGCKIEAGGAVFRLNIPCET